jgi:hypothetical protein
LTRARKQGQGGGVTSTEDFTKTWRYKLGLFLIVVGHLVIAGALVLPLLGASAAVVGAAVLSGELMSMASIVFLGKDGFLAIKKKVFGFLKRGFTAEVGPARHYLGLVLFFLNGLTLYIMMVYAWTSFSAVTPEDPLPIVWGLDFRQQEKLVFGLFLTGEIAFLVSIYVLGADWWERFRALIVYRRAPARADD